MIIKVFNSFKEILLNWIVAIFVIFDFIGFIQEKFTGFKIDFGYLIFLGLLISSIKIIYEKNEIIIKSRNNNKNSIEPDVAISIFKKMSRYLLELNNTGQEDINELKVNIEWLQDSKIETRQLNQFFNESEDPVLSRSHECNYLKKEGTKIISGIPLYSDNGKIKFIVNGVGVKSKKKLEKQFILNNDIKP